MKYFFFVLVSLTFGLSAFSCSGDNDSDNFVSDSIASSSSAKKFVGYWDGYDDIVFDKTGRCCVSGSFGIWSYNTETSAISTIVESKTNIWKIATIDDKSWTGSTTEGSSRGFTKMTEYEFIIWIFRMKSKLVDKDENSLSNYQIDQDLKYYILGNSNQERITFNPNNEISYSFFYETIITGYGPTIKNIENAGTIKIFDPYDFQKMKVEFTGSIEGTFHFKSSYFVN